MSASKSSNRLRIGRCQLWLVLFLVWGSASPGGGEAQMQQMGGERVLFDQDEMRGTDDPRVRSIFAEPGIIGWDVEMHISNSRLVDLDLYLYREDPKEVTFAEPICASEGVGALERCRVFIEEGEQIWVEVLPFGDDSRTRFSVTARPLRGPRIEGTDLVSEDAGVAFYGGEVNQVEFVDESGQLIRQRLFEVPLHLMDPGLRTSDSVRISLYSAEMENSVYLSVFNSEGERIAGAARPSYMHQLTANALDEEQLYLLIEPTNVSRIRSGGYSIDVAGMGSAIPLRLGQENLVLEGDGERAYDLHLGSFDLATLVFDGPSSSLSVTEVSGDRLLESGTFGGVRQIVHLGEPHESSEHLLQGRFDSTEYRIRVEPLESRTYRPRSWRLEVRNSNEPFGFVVPFNPDESGEWQNRWDLEATRYTGWVSEGGRHVVRVTQPPEELTKAIAAKYGGRIGFRAELDMESAKGLDIAICNVFGEVLDIEYSSIVWSWPEGETALYLVVFTPPNLDPQEDREFSVEIFFGPDLGILK